MPDDVKVSVVIPLFNADGWIDEQLASLVAQDFTEAWEVVVADNGSTDGSRDRAAAFADRLNLRIVDASDCPGGPHARNVGAREARGQYLAFCDQDDVAAPGWISSLYAAAKPEVILGGVRDPSKLNSEIANVTRGGERNDGLTPGPCELMPVVWTANMLISRKWFFELGGFDESLKVGDDADLCYRAQLAGHKLEFVSDAVMYYRYREDLRSMVHQLTTYSVWEAEMYKRYRVAGAHRRSLATVGRRWWWDVSRAPLALLSEKRRFIWCSLACQDFGKLKGSWASRVFYP